MRLKLTVSNSETGALAGTYVFEQDTVRIGRAVDNELSLDDPASIVSKHHAVVRREGMGYVAEDLGSKNFTFVNGDRVGSARPRPVRTGDNIEVGPFRLLVEVEQPPPAAAAGRDLEQTVFAPSFANPFTEEAEALAEAFGRLRRAVMMSGYPRRDDALSDALRDAFGPGGDADALHDVVRGEAPPSIGAPPAEAPPAPAPTSPPAWEPPAPAGTPGPAWLNYVPPPQGLFPEDDPTNTRPPAPLPPTPAVWSGPPQPDPFITGEDTGASHPSARAGDPLPDEVALRMLRVVTRLLGIPWQFRHEFIGQTILHTPETAFLYESDAASLWRYLRDPTTREERLAVLEDAAEQAVVHQVAMLEGYRAATERGAGTLLDALDPAALQDEPAGHAVGRLLSAVKGGGGLAERLRQRLDELRAEGASVLERRYFRPAFIDAYLARLAGHRPPPSDF